MKCKTELLSDKKQQEHALEAETKNDNETKIMMERKQRAIEIANTDIKNEQY